MVLFLSLILAVSPVSAYASDLAVQMTGPDAPASFAGCTCFLLLDGDTAVEIYKEESVISNPEYMATGIEASKVY